MNTNKVDGGVAIKLCDCTVHDANACMPITNPPMWLRKVWNITHEKMRRWAWNVPRI